MGAGLIALAIMAGYSAPSWAQLSDDATTSTEGTQFIREQETDTPPVEEIKPDEKKPEVPAAIKKEVTEKPVVTNPPRYPTVVFLVDTSDSMLNRLPGAKGSRLDEAKAALIRVLQGMPAKSRVQLWTFNRSMEPILIDRVKKGRFILIGKKGHRQALIDQVRKLRTSGGTNLYQSIVKAMRNFSARRDQRFYRLGIRYPVLVVVSDGEDGGKTRETLKTVQKTKEKFPLVTINTIGFKISRSNQWFQVLCQIATSKEGCAIAGNEGQLVQMLEGFSRPPPSS